MSERLYGWALSQVYARYGERLSGAGLGPVICHRLEQAGLLSSGQGRRSWLDLCCGAGHLLAYARSQGYRVVGVDGSADQLRQARRAVPQASLVQADATAVRLAERFDVVTCVGGSTNYLLQQERLLRLLRAGRRHLAPGGWWCFDVNTPVGYQVNAGRQAVVGDDHVAVFTIASRSRPGRAVWQVTGFVRRGRSWRRFDENHELRGYEVEQVDALCRRAGLRFDRCDADTLARPDSQTARLLYCCRSARQ